MHIDLDTLLTALYVALTDCIMPSLESAPDRPGRPPEVTDAEVVCIAVAQAHLRFNDERHWIRSAPKLIGHLFPRLLSQSQYNVRLRAVGPLMQHTVFYLATACPSSQDVVRLIDGTKVICGTSRTTVRCSNLFGYAGYGYDKSHSVYFWGCKLLLEVTADGLVTGFVLVNPKLIDERRAVLLMQEQPYTTMPHATTAVGDKGFRSKPFEAELLDQGVVLVRPAMRNETDPGVFPKWFRNRVESVIDTLKGQLGIEHPGAHEPSGLFARVVQRILALNAAVWHNWSTGAHVKRSLIAYDH
ncbi:IS982 family transposase [Actinospica robiniae]|uniref:IS982 family transposase n=1 Tax=Actinospica robiniae TaxID=304901 RepID=UPI000419FC2E|nr:IS982 family transposase [Actinospica robiniae]